jgi:hypothetical protein
MQQTVNARRPAAIQYPISKLYMDAMKLIAGAGFVQYANQIDGRVAALQRGCQLVFCKWVRLDQFHRSAEQKISKALRVPADYTAQYAAGRQARDQMTTDKTCSAEDAYTGGFHLITPR